MLNARNTLGMSGRSRRSSLLGALLAVAAATLLVASEAASQSLSDQNAEPFTVFGRVVSAETGEALPGAWVGITGTEWGSITNDAGRFRIPDLDAGRLALTVELLGYETLAWVGNVAGPEEALEIQLAPRAVLLEGLEVMVDRFRSRRNSVATSVFAYEPAELSSSASRTALEFVEARVGTFSTACRGRRGDRCLIVRGRTVEPAVYVDEAPVVGGLDYLSAFAPWEFHMIEVYGGGSQIRAYTPRYMERVAERPIFPLRIF